MILHTIYKCWCGSGDDVGDNDDGGGGERDKHRSEEARALEHDATDEEHGALEPFIPNPFLPSSAPIYTSHFRFCSS